MPSERYQKEIEDLTAYFAVRLPACGPIVLTPEERKDGVDSLPKTSLAAALVRSACTEWLLTRNYDLSYNQVCCAFFAALESPPATLPSTGAPRDDLVAEVQRRMDAVVDAAVDWATSEDEEFDRCEILSE
jgi:hypothetical protein